MGLLKLTAVTDQRYLDELAHAVEIEAIERLRLALEQVGQEVVDFLRTLAEPPEWRPGLARSRRTGKLYQPGFIGPRRANSRIKLEGPRRAYPGHWAARSGQLALSYSFEVVVGADSVTLILRNTAEYAFWVEVMDGFYVLSGVMDDGGPVEHALRAIVGRLFPDWRVVNTGTRTIEARA
jgi:hypothetical protein